MSSCSTQKQRQHLWLSSTTFLIGDQHLPYHEISCPRHPRVSHSCTRTQYSQHKHHSPTFQIGPAAPLPPRTLTWQAGTSCLPFLIFCSYVFVFVLHCLPIHNTKFCYFSPSFFSILPSTSIHPSILPFLPLQIITQVHRCPNTTPLSIHEPCPYVVLCAAPTLVPQSPWSHQSQINDVPTF